jgi:putative oxidoreductase
LPERAGRAVTIVPAGAAPTVLSGRRAKATGAGWCAGRKRSAGAVGICIDGKALMSSLNSLQQVWAPRALSLLRFVVGLCFLEHGLTKLFGFPPSPVFAHMHLSTLLAGFAPLWVQGVIELVGGVLVCVGLFTRPAAFVLAGDMAIAYFAAHLPRSPFPEINGGDAAILYCFVFFYIFFAGSGPISLDYVLGRTGVSAETPLAAGQRHA